MTEDGDVTCKNDVGNIPQAQGRLTEQQEGELRHKRSSQWGWKAGKKALSTFTTRAQVLSLSLP